MFVVELRGYLQTPEGVDLIPPIGRISLHEDRDNDGCLRAPLRLRRQAGVSRGS